MTITVSNVKALNEFKDDLESKAQEMSDRVSDIDTKLNYIDNKGQGIVAEIRVIGSDDDGVRISLRTVNNAIDEISNSHDIIVLNTSGLISGVVLRVKIENTE